MKDKKEKELKDNELNEKELDKVTGGKKFVDRRTLDKLSPEDIIRIKKEHSDGYRISYR